MRQAAPCNQWTSLLEGNLQERNRADSDPEVFAAALHTSEGTLGQFYS